MPDASSAMPKTDTLLASDLPLLVLVGVTGVGKSTTLAALTEAGCTVTLLPDRRRLTDELIIPAVQAADGEAPHPVTDRTQRFDYTRRYRQLHRGGMAHALTQLQVAPDAHPGLLCFDGLRGVEEVRYAAEHLPLACFVVLDAPDPLRVQRLLGRGDAFDRVTLQSGQGAISDLRLHDLPGVESVFNAEEQAALLALVETGEVELAALRDKVAIVVAERRNYDPAAAIAELRRLAPDRTLVVNTATTPPAEVAGQIIIFWKRVSGEGQRARGERRRV